MDARGVLGGVVQQFGQRMACLRELVQNAIDADTDRVDIRFDRDGGFARIQVEDYGCGMSLEDIDIYLLNVFRSSKEGDLQTIGKFGIGFVSVFALQPRHVVVETSKDGEHTRIVIDHDYAIRYYQGEPRLGTAVSMYLDADDKRLAELARDGLAFLEHSCQYVDIELVLHAEAVGGAQQLNRPFDLDLPYVARWSEPGTEVVVGYGDPAPGLCLMNRRLTLLREPRALLPGVSALVSSRHIEHNLARNAVIQDNKLERVMARVKALIDDTLFPMLLRDFQQAEAGPHPAKTLDVVVQIVANDRKPPYDALLDLPVVPVISDGEERRISLKRALTLAAGGALVTVLDLDSESLAGQVARRFTVVRSTALWPIGEALGKLAGDELLDADRDFGACLPVSLPIRARLLPLLDAARRWLPTGLIVEPVRLHLPGTEPRLALRVETIGAVWRSGETPEGALVALQAAHPLTRALEALAHRRPALAGHLLTHALAVDGVVPADANDLLDVWLATEEPAVP